MINWPENLVHSKKSDQSNIENNKITDKQTIANNFNSYFSNIGIYISNNVPISEFDYLHYMEAPTHKHNMLVNPLDIIETTSKLKANSSQGHDTISCRLMKYTIEHIALHNIISLYWYCTTYGGSGDYT